MKLTFLGTRGEIEARTDRHGMHSSMLVEYHGRGVMIDCGEDWLGRIPEVGPLAIVITHAHPDHAWGLKDGAPCPVYATAESWETMGDYPIMDKEIVRPGTPFRAAGITFDAYTVEHSTRAPAVCYRVTAGEVTAVYAPDVVYIHDREKALRGADLYVGDGATPRAPMIRKRGEKLIGHTPMMTQLTWCKKESVPRAVFTHCGSRIVAGDESAVEKKLSGWAEERGVEAEIAYDGMEIVLR